MEDFLKNNKVILALILLLGLGLRLWNINSPEGIWHSEYIACTFSAFDFPFDFFNALKTNSHAPLHCYYMKLWNLLFNNSAFMYKLSSLLPNLGACFVMYFVGKNYQLKDGSAKLGLTCALIASISSFLIYFSQEAKIYSLIFLLTSCVLLYSIKVYEFPSKKNYSLLTLFSILLILEHTIGIIFVIFNTFALIAFRQKNKKHKNDSDFFIPVLSMLILCLPLIPFLFRIFAHPTYFSQWWAPFSWSKIFFFFTDLFSPILRNITQSPSGFYNQIITNNIINIGFVMFALIPAGIMLFAIIKSNIESRKINKYMLSCVLSTFLTVLIATIAGKLPFLTKYFIELYPILILMASLGLVQLNSRNTRIMLLTIYVFLTLFYIIVSHITSINLV